MKTSNKLLLGLLIAALTFITVFIGVARYFSDSSRTVGNGKRTSQIREADKFNKIYVKGKFTVYLSQGENSQLKINADENLIPLVESIVDQGELKIQLKKRIGRKDKVDLYITADSLNSIELAAGVELEGQNQLKGNHLSIEATAGTNANLNLDYHEMEGKSHAGSELILAGKTAVARLIASSGSSILAEKLVIGKCIVEGSSGAKTKIHVTDELEAEMSSGATLTYEGNPRVTKANYNSGGNINKK